MYFLGIFEGHSDPSACICKDGKVIAYAEEERFLRYKHAFGIYPIQSIQYCLSTAGIEFSDLDAVGINWDLESFDNGTIKSFYDDLNSKHAVDSGTKGWQNSMLSRFTTKSIISRHHSHWHKAFGVTDFPEIVGIPHHYTHAFQACYQSSFSSATCLVIDGSGDTDCTSIWSYQNGALNKIFSRSIPHSLGWFYAAITEFLGFEAYDGEYKVMGLASYGSPNSYFASKLREVLSVDNESLYVLNPKYIHYGKHTFSKRFTDEFVELLSLQPRLPSEPITNSHKDLAYEAQSLLEEVAIYIADYAIKLTGIHNLCVGGGVGLNIKMNSALTKQSFVHKFFAHPLCSDGGSSQAVALALNKKVGQSRIEDLTSLALGPDYSDDYIRELLTVCKVKYTESFDICKDTAMLISRGNVIGWFQGRMEAGPRALGQRSILADPRTLASRDKVNAVIKFREDWRPFCPSIAAEFLHTYFDDFYISPFMNNAFPANDHLKTVAPAIVHIDGTARIQAVDQLSNPLYHRLIMDFYSITDVAVLLNTSFNVKGEPVVMSPSDALRTFFASGMDYLCLGNFILSK